MLPTRFSDRMQAAPHGLRPQGREVCGGPCSRAGTARGRGRSSIRIRTVERLPRGSALCVSWPSARGRSPLSSRGTRMWLDLGNSPSGEPGAAQIRLVLGGGVL